MKSEQSNSPSQFRQVEDNELRAISGGVKATTIDGITYDCIGYIGRDGIWRPHAARPGLEIDWSVASVDG